MRISSCALLIALGSAAAPAQTFEVSAFGAYPRIRQAPLGSISAESAEDNDTTIKGQHGYGARFTWNTPGYYGHELTYMVSRARLRTTLRTTEDRVTVTRVKEDRIPINLAGYNFLIYFMPKNERWRPFITGGVQLHDYGAPNIAEWDRGSSRNYGANYGVGLKLMPVKHFLVRLDFRDYIGGKPYDLQFKEVSRSGGLLHTMAFSFGVSIGF